MRAAAADIRLRDSGRAIRLYLKLTAFVVVFIVLSWLSGDAADMHLYEVGFAFRCQIAMLRQDATMQESLAQEHQQHVRVMKERDVQAAATVASRGVASRAVTTRPTTSRALLDL
jgi:hypothetical protein